MKKQFILLAVAGLVLTSCGIYTKYQRPEDITTDGLYGHDLDGQSLDSLSLFAASDTTSIASLSWRELFTDPQLQSLIEQALQGNTDLLSAQQRIKEAEATLMSAKLSYLSSFMLTPQCGVSSFDNSKGSWTYSGIASASWRVDIWANLTSAMRCSKALYLQSLEYEQAVSTSLIAMWPTFTLLILDEQYRISEETAASWRESARTMRAMMAAGMTNEASVSQSEANCRPGGSFAARPPAAGKGNAARSAFYPSITLSGTAGWTNSAGSMIVNPGKLLLSVIDSLTQPLFNKGLNVAQLKIAKAQQEEARLAFQQALLNAGSEVNNALTQVQVARGKTELCTRQITSLETTVRSTRLLMRHGTSTYLEVLTAQQGLLSAQLTQVADRFDEIQGIINLYQALGGGRE